MKNSGVYDQDLIVENIATGYKLRDTGMVTDPYYEMKKFYACGGIYSTQSDVNKWLRGLSSNLLLSPDSFYRISSPVEGNYGYGCRISETDGMQYICHDGYIKGHYSHIRLYPSKGIRMQILRNSSAFSSQSPDELNPDGVCSKIANILKIARTLK